jgi:putative endonuclease
MKHFVYIIKSKVDGKNYIGVTSDLEVRLEWHNLGKNTSTRFRRPFEMVYNKEFADKSEALRYERWLKQQKGGFKVKELIKMFNMPR